MADFERVLNDYNLERKDLDFKCQRSIILSVSGRIIDEPYLFGGAVGVSEIKLTSIRRNVNLSPEETPVAVLDAWVEENGREATCLKLAEALYDRKKINTLEILCEKVKRDAAAAKTSESGAVVSCHPSGSQRQQQEMPTDPTSTLGVTVVKASPDGGKKGQKMQRTVMKEMKCRFASLVMKVRKAIEAQPVEVKDVHQFLVLLFQGVCCIPCLSDVTKTFNFVTEAELWSYNNFGPLKDVVEQFLPSDKSVKNSITDYRNQHSGYCATINIIEFEELLEEEDSDEENQETFSPEKYKKDYRKLKLKLNLDKKPTEVTLANVNTLWQALAEEFDIPSLTTVIEKIVRGSIVIIWCIPSRFAEKIQTSPSKALRFFQRHNIVEVDIDGDILYDEWWLNGSTALHQASFAGETEEVEKLLAEGVDIDQQDDVFGYTALHFASWQGHSNIVKILVDNGAVIDMTGNYGRTALMWASIGGHTEVVKVLVEAKADLNITDQYGDTALINAAQEGHTSTVKILVDLGAAVDIQNKWPDDTALIKAAEKGHTSTVKMLVDLGAAVDIQDKVGWTALMWASAEGDTEVVKVLAEAKADLNITDEWGYTALIKAAEKGHTSTVKILVDLGAAVDIQDKTGRTALMKASDEDHTEVVKVLVEAKADLNITDQDGWIALMYASYGGHTEVVKVLAEAKADLNITDQGGDTALIDAATKGHTSIVKILVDHGAATDIRNEYGRTALMKASDEDHTEVVKVLVEAKADLNITDQDGWTALVYASLYGHTEVVNVLAEAKADLNITDKDGDTALIDAVSNGHTSIVNILVDRGAATDIRNKEGLTALDVAQARDFSEICKILEHYTREDSTSKLTEEQKAEHKQSIGQRFLKMAERIFLREQVKKKEQLQQQQQKEGLNRESSHRPFDGGMKKRSLWSRIRGQRNRPTQTVGTAPAVP